MYNQQPEPIPKVDSIPMFKFKVFFASLVPRLSLQVTDSRTGSGNEDTILLNFQEGLGSQHTSVHVQVYLQ